MVFIRPQSELKVKLDPKALPSLILDFSSLLSSPAVRKAAEEKKDKMGPQWSRWVGKAVHKLVSADSPGIDNDSIIVRFLGTRWSARIG
jgi:hypothetical protein